MKRGFTMIELVFVIVILGILASIAIPRLAASRDDARAVSIKTDIGTLSQAVPAWYQSQNDISIENAMQFDTSLWRHGAFTDTMEYQFVDVEGGTINVKVIAANINNTAANITTAEKNTAIGMGEVNKSISGSLANNMVPWLLVRLVPPATNRGIVYTLLNDMQVSNETLVPMAGRRVNWNF